MSLIRFCQKNVTQKVASKSIRFIRQNSDAPVKSTREKLADFIGLVGAVANWGIPLATISLLGMDVEKVNPRMTSALFLYSIFFVRWAVAVHPRNYPLFLCHVTNVLAQGANLGRWAVHSISNKKEEVSA
eukprot:TRINITY_DN11408_c0_g1_i1.p1 TRINITY_DN11408_c0_g1~~TRINITY_DN11408_c0_g1_i1.p1  ORF type:complete len:137 (-),score=22.17 TRINITY_DN11408_c0_g1_i1:94-483(-)